MQSFIVIPGLTMVFSIPSQPIPWEKADGFVVLNNRVSDGPYCYEGSVVHYAIESVFYGKDKGLGFVYAPRVAKALRDFFITQRILLPTVHNLILGQKPENPFGSEPARSGYVVDGKEVDLHAIIRKEPKK
jgi:hypothetical protein